MGEPAGNTKHRATHVVLVVLVTKLVLVVGLETIDLGLSKNVCVRTG
jgi:hypothetical protein